MSIELVMLSSQLILCHIFFPFAFNISQHQGLLKWVGSSHQVAKVLEFQLQHQSFQWIFFLKDWLVWSPCSPKDSQESSPAPKFESINSSVLSFLMVQFSHPHMTTGKTMALIIWTFVGKVMSLLFNTLSRLIIAFLPRNKHLLILLTVYHEIKSKLIISWEPYKQYILLTFP